MKARTAKTRRHRITPEAVEAFRRALTTAGGYAACIAGEGCTAPGGREHCETCARHLDARRALHRVLDLRPWQPSPLDTGADAPPEWSRPGTPWHDAWALVRRLRLELEIAAGRR